MYHIIQIIIDTHDCKLMSGCIFQTSFECLFQCQNRFQLAYLCILTLQIRSKIKLIYTKTT